MKRKLGIARCGLACCLCSENAYCQGCELNGCANDEACINKRCSNEKGLKHCYECEENCSAGILSKIKPKAFTEFAKRYGEEMLLDCLEENEKKGIVYHRKGIIGDYDEFDDEEELILFIKNGKR